MKKLMGARPNGTFTNLILAFATAASVIAADLKVPTDYATIQAAVNAASDGDVIRIAPGVYKEQVQIISKTLTLVGQPGTILRATDAMSSPQDSMNFPIIFIRFSQVTLRGLTFEGERLAERFVGEGQLLGIALRESGGNVENCAFYGFRESTPGLEGAMAIFVFKSEDPLVVVNVRVVGSTFADNYRGIYLVGTPTNQSINVTIENSTFIGPGPLDTQDNNYACIAIGEGVFARITGNTISGFSYGGTTAAFPIGFGILVDNESNWPEFGVAGPVEIEGNTFRDNQVHIGLVKANGSIVRNNHVQGTAPGILPLGLAVTGTNVTIANNQFENMPEGIRLLGNDPDYGTLLGLTINAQVTSNRFCNVTTPINLEPLATATETGTLTNSCSTNALIIAPAALVSWPVEQDAWTLESATNVVGPWTPSAATSFLQSGTRNVAVPTDGHSQFFRLRQP